MAEKTNLEKKPNSWVCVEGCDVSTTICSHLEKELPHMNYGKTRIAETATFSVSFFEANNPKFSLPKFTDLLKNYGFTATWDLELLTARYFYNMSYRQIENEYNYVGKSEVHRRIKQLEAQLKERGFEQELE